MRGKAAESHLISALMSRSGKREGDDIRFRCPFPDNHNNGDADPSARYNFEKEAWYCDVCKAGGGWTELCKLLGVSTTGQTKRSEITARYQYRKETGKLLRRKLRWEPGLNGKKKSFSWEKPDEQGGWVKCSGDGNPQVLYYSEKLPAAREKGERVLVVEGEKDTDRAATLGILAVCNPEGAGSWKDAYTEQLKDLDVVVIADNDEVGRKHAASVAASLSPLAKSVRVLELPGKSVNDLSDWVANEERDGRGRDELRACLNDLCAEAEIYEAEPQTVSAPPAEKDAEVLLRLARELNVSPFHSGDGRAYVDIHVGGHRETWPVKSSGLEGRLRLAFFEERRKAPNAQALKDAISTLEARAQFRGPKRTVAYRVSYTDSAIYVDLANDSWEVVEITARDWKVITSPDVRFIRRPTTRPLPRPKRGGSLAALRPLLNLPNDDAFILLCSYLLACLGPGGPYPVLVLHGEQGSAKSTLARMIKALIDPSKAPLRTIPKNEQDLMIAAQGSHVLAFDNLSGIKPWLSDAFCRLATGCGFSARKLYTDEEEIVFEAMRPIILNGIDDVIGREDLLDRSLILSLPSIPDHERRPEGEIWAELNQLLPGVLGVLLDAASCGLRRRNEVQLDYMPRMADFAKWNAAAAPALPWSEGEFLGVYESNRSEAVEVSLSSNEFAIAVRSLVEVEGEFEGTATDLLRALEDRTPEAIVRLKQWPKSARALSSWLRRIASPLRMSGFEVDFQREAGTGRRLIRLRNRESDIDRHDRNNRHKPRNRGTSRDGRDEAVTELTERVSAARPRDPAIRDGRDGCDANLPDVQHSANDADELRVLP